MIRRKPNLSPEMNEALDALDDARAAIGICTMKRIEYNWKQTFTDEQLLAGEHLP